MIKVFRLRLVVVHVTTVFLLKSLITRDLLFIIINFYSDEILRCFVILFVGV